ncbi:MAG: hypothetical protein K2G34_08350, partial [Bacteroides sp.]|nr:hypothetical protein [Bacteroides sp.]
MTKDIPEIDDLLKGINDPEMTLTDEHTETTIEKQSESVEEWLTPVLDTSDYWQDFLSCLENNAQEDKGERMICKLDRD